jgi:hypothetical protein
MISPYVQSKIKEILAETKGKVTTAQDKLTELAMNDDLLLRGLTQPYLKGIIAHAVARVTGQAVPVPSSDYSKNLIKDEVPESSGKKSSAIDMLLSQMSNNINPNSHLSEAAVKKNMQTQFAFLLKHRRKRKADINYFLELSSGASG